VDDAADAFLRAAQTRVQRGRSTSVAISRSATAIDGAAVKIAGSARRVRRLAAEKKAIDIGSFTPTRRSQARDLLEPDGDGWTRGFGHARVLSGTPNHYVEGDTRTERV